MLIEKDARRFIFQAIKFEQEIKFIEAKERLKGRIVIRSQQYDNARKSFIKILNNINAVANIQGKGRDDLQCEILLAAEEISRKITNSKSKAIRKLAESIKTNFQNLRMLFRKYAENIESIDPQLRNNSELCDALLAFEKSWEKGKEFLLNDEQTKILLSMSELIEGMMEKHKELNDKIENIDSDIFMIVPCLAILKSIEEEDKEILTKYYWGEPKDQYLNLYVIIKSEYYRIKLKTEGYELYNFMERLILEKDNKSCKNIDVEEISKLIHEIKKLAIMIQRGKPTEWNSLMEASMGII